MASYADLAAPASLERFVTHQIHAGSGWHTGFDDAQEDMAAHRQGIPASSGAHLVKEAPGAGLAGAAGAQRCCNRAASLAR